MTDQTPDLDVYVDRIIQELAELDVRKAALTLQLTSVRDKLKGFRRRNVKANGAGKKERRPRAAKRPALTLPPTAMTHV